MKAANQAANQTGFGKYDEGVRRIMRMHFRRSMQLVSFSTFLA